MRILITVLLGLCLSFTAAAAEFALTSPAFSENGTIPILYSCDGKNISPPLDWKNTPKGTVAFALIVSVPDAPWGIFYSWIIFNLPGSMTSLPEAINESMPEDILVGSTSIGDAIYRGPCPPDSFKHHYVFTLYALDEKLNLSNGADISDVVIEIKRHTIKKTSLTGVFKH